MPQYDKIFCLLCVFSSFLLCLFIKFWIYVLKVQMILWIPHNFSKKLLEKILKYPNEHTDVILEIVIQAQFLPYSKQVNKVTMDPLLVVSICMHLRARQFLILWHFLLKIMMPGLKHSSVDGKKWEQMVIAKRMSLNWVTEFENFDSNNCSTDLWGAQSKEMSFSSSCEPLNLT